MDTIQKDIRYDEDLRLEAYRFGGLAKAFPNHFHEYYVIGLIETGERSLTVNNREYTIGPGDLLTFNPMDNHACTQRDGGTLHYLCLNVSEEVMASAAGEVLLGNGLPRFGKPVQHRTNLAPVYRELHGSIMNGLPPLEREELFLLFMQQLLTAHAQPAGSAASNPARQEIDDVCAYLEAHYTERVTLEQLGGIAGLNKYTLIRTFTKTKGITPYRYLETLRINAAKKLLEQGVEPAEAALRTGFSDQSHFTSYFSRFIGLSPGQYRAIFGEGPQGAGEQDA